MKSVKIARIFIYFLTFSYEISIQNRYRVRFIIQNQQEQQQLRVSLLSQCVNNNQKFDQKYSELDFLSLSLYFSTYYPQKIKSVTIEREKENLIINIEKKQTHASDWLPRRVNFNLIGNRTKEKLISSLLSSQCVYFSHLFVFFVLIILRITNLKINNDNNNLISLFQRFKNK